MPRIIRFLFKWSLEITGTSIILFNYQPYIRQQQIIGFYHSTCNAFRTFRYLGSLANDFRHLINTPIDSELYHNKAEAFKTKSAEKFEQLCQANRGIYARMGQIMSGMTRILPSAYLIQLKKLENVSPL